MTVPRLITTSEVRTYQRCREEHRIAYLLGVRPVEKAEALRLGTLVHLGLEQIWRGQTGFTLDDASDPFEAAKATAMLYGYMHRWTRPDVVLFVEEKYQLARDGYVHAGKLDAGAQDEEKRAFLVEHKTTTEDISPGSDYWARLVIDDQVSNYFDGAKTLGFDVDACIYDVLRVPECRPYKATPAESRKYKKDGGLYANQREQDETPEEFFARCRNAIAEDIEGHYRRMEVVRFDHELERARKELATLAHEILAVDPTEKQIRNPGACRRYGKSCPYLPVCSGEAELTDTRYRKTEAQHEELAS